MLPKLTIEIPRERIADLIQTGLEGGIEYWGGVLLWDHIGPSPEAPERAKYRHKIAHLLAYGGVARFEVTDEWGHVEETRRLGNVEIEQGLSLLGSVAGGRHLGNFLSGNEDAETGDVFIQLCLFGEVVFG